MLGKTRTTGIRKILVYTAAVKIRVPTIRRENSVQRFIQSNEKKWKFLVKNSKNSGIEYIRQKNRNKKIKQKILAFDMKRYIS